MRAKRAKFLGERLALVPLNLLYPFKLSVQNTQNKKSRTTNWNFKEGPLNSRTFQGQIHFQGLFKEIPKFKDFSRTVGTLYNIQKRRVHFIWRTTSSLSLYFKGAVQRIFSSFDVILKYNVEDRRGPEQFDPSPGSIHASSHCKCICVNCLKNTELHWSPIVPYWEISRKCSAIIL